MIKYGTWLFWSLALISMVWTFGMMAMQGDGINTALAEIVRFFVVIGFFLVFTVQWTSYCNGYHQINVANRCRGHRAKCRLPGGVTQIVA